MAIRRDLLRAPRDRWPTAVAFLAALAAPAAGLAVACPARAAVVHVPIRPLDASTGAVGRPLAATVRVRLPAGGHVREGVGLDRQARTWVGPAFAQRCRVRLDLEAVAVPGRADDVESGQAPVAFVVHGGVRYARSAVELDDTLALSGYARFALPAELAAPGARLVYLELTVHRDLDHCIRPVRQAGRPVVAAVLRSTRLGRPG